MHRSRCSRLLLASIGALALMTSAIAGPLNPPAGPIVSTPGPEPRIPINAINTPGDADSTFKITQAGSYYLTGNVAAAAARHGIEITASSVTIDLMGFEVAGTVGTLDGIACTGGTRRGITVRNGVVRGFGGDGVDLLLAEQVRLESLTAVSNTGHGVRVGPEAVLTECIASLNTQSGFGSSEGAVFRDCVAGQNGSDGFDVEGTGSGSLTNCAAEANVGIGFHGFGQYSFDTCVARDNGSDGFFVGQEGATLLNCGARSNGGDGIFVIQGTVSDSASVVNAGIGIRVNLGNVSRCMAGSNGSHGIQVEGASVLVGNTCRNNGTATTTGAGIRVLTGDGSRVDGNNCDGNDRGIDVTAAGNVIVRNTCNANTTNFVIAANNIYGPIIDRSAPASAAVSGSAAAGTMGSSDSNSNFSY